MAKKSKGKKEKRKPSASASRQRVGADAGKGTGGPRSQTLPGMNKVRSQRLDNYCEAISEDRKKIADLRADEQGSIQGALKEMKAKRLGSYTHAGVELAFVPGADKLRVRLTKEQSDASMGMGDEPTPESEAADANLEAMQGAVE